MPRTTLSVETTSRTGLEATYTAFDQPNGHDFDNSGQKTIVHIVNGATAAVVTIPTSATVDGQAVADRTISIGANEEHFIGPFANSTYGNGGSTVYLDIDDATNVTVAILKVGTAG